MTMKIQTPQPRTAIATNQERSELTTSLRVEPGDITLETTLAAFVRALEGKNRSVATRRAYQADVTHFLEWIHANNLVAHTAADVSKRDISEYLAYLAQTRNVSGVSRARKLAALREYFRFQVDEYGFLVKSPTDGLETPKKEKNVRVFLRAEEYTRMLSLAGSSPRDFAILQLFLQTGIRVSELCALTIADIDFEGRLVKITAGKGMVAREIELEKKGLQAVRSYLAVRPQNFEDHLFLNRDGEPLGERGVRKIVVKYRDAAGITKKASCHSLRHTFATYKAERGVSPFQLQQWLGHSSLATTQIYVHLGKQNARKVMEGTSL